MTQLRLCTLSILASMLMASVCLGATDSTVAPATASTNLVGDLDNLGKAEILKLIQNLADELKQTRSELEQLKAARQEEKPKVIPPVSQSIPVPPVVPVHEAPKEQTEAEKDRERVERERAIQSVQRSGVLLPQGKFDIEPSFTYSHTSRNFINVDGFSILPVLIIGNIQALRVERDVFQTQLALRYGIIPNLQVDASVPWQSETDRYVTQSYQNNVQLAPKESGRHDQGIGDPQLGLSYQLLHEHGWVPDLIVQSTGRAPIGKSQFDIHSNSQLAQGSGVWGVRNGITAIKTMDPIVLIFNTGYTYNFGRDLTAQRITSTGTNVVTTTYQPGGSIDNGVAVAIAMNPSFAINLGVLERYTFSTELTGVGTVQGSSLNEAQFRFGFAWAVTRNSVFNFTAAMGLTEDSPGLTITIAYPIKF